VAVFRELAFEGLADKREADRHLFRGRLTSHYVFYFAEYEVYPCSGICLDIVALR